MEINGYHTGMLVSTVDKNNKVYAVIEKIRKIEHNEMYFAEIKLLNGSKEVPLYLLTKENIDSEDKKSIFAQILTRS